MRDAANDSPKYKTAPTPPTASQKLPDFPLPGATNPQQPGVINSLPPLFQLFLWLLMSEETGIEACLGRQQ